MLFVIVPLNLANKFQHLGIPVTKPSKSFIARSYNFQNKLKVSKSLLEVTQLVNVNLPLHFIKFKPIKSYWISDVHYYLCNKRKEFIKHFRTAGYTDAVEPARSVWESLENPAYSKFVILASY